MNHLENWPTGDGTGSDWDVLSNGSGANYDIKQTLVLNQIKVLAALLRFPQGNEVASKATNIQRIVRGWMMHPKAGQARDAAVYIQTAFRRHAQSAIYTRLRKFPARTKYELLMRMELESACVAQLTDKVKVLEDKVESMTPALVPGTSVVLKYLFKSSCLYINSSSDAVIGANLALEEVIFTVVDAGNNMIALHHTLSNRFLRLKDGKVDGRGGPMDVDKLPRNWGAERFIPVKVNSEEALPGVMLYSPCNLKYIFHWKGNVFEQRDLCGPAAVFFAIPSSEYLAFTGDNMAA